MWALGKKEGRGGETERRESPPFSLSRPLRPCSAALAEAEAAATFTHFQRLLSEAVDTKKDFSKDRRRGGKGQNRRRRKTKKAASTISRRKKDQEEEESLKGEGTVTGGRKVAGDRQTDTDGEILSDDVLPREKATGIW